MPQISDLPAEIGLAAIIFGVIWLIAYAQDANLRWRNEAAMRKRQHDQERHERDPWLR